MDIIANILNSIRANGESGASKSHIVEFADVSYMKLKDYVPILDKYELWVSDEEKGVYFITVKGNEYLELYELMSQLDEVVPRKAMAVMTSPNKSYTRVYQMK